MLFWKNVLFTLMMPGTVAVYVPRWLVGGGVTGPLWWLAPPVFAAGGGIYLWCVWDFATFGRGTPLPLDAPKHLVVRGLYRYVRNPMYVGVLTVILGWALYYAHPLLVLYLATVWCAFQCFVVMYEEPTLRRLFGDSYVDYCRRVNRWLPTLR